MKKRMYRVYVSVVDYVYVDVRASTPEEAEDIALKKLELGEYTLEESDLIVDGYKVIE